MVRATSFTWSRATCTHHIQRTHTYMYMYMYMYHQPSRVENVFITCGLVKPAQSKLDALEAVTTPTTKRQVRAFLGLAGYYRRFIPDFSSIATPLTDLLRKNCLQCGHTCKDCKPLQARLHQLWGRSFVMHE